MVPSYGAHWIAGLNFPNRRLEELLKSLESSLERPGGFEWVFVEGRALLYNNS